jgi:iron complex transport system substrate-binding protein
MKRKENTSWKRRFVLLEIAIVLCSILLVSNLPAIAADQTDEPLGIYGNANEDDTIDMRDTTYIKLVIFGKKPKTDFADANNDGKVSMLDVGQTKLIILGKEKELTILNDPQWATPEWRVVEKFEKPVRCILLRDYHGDVGDIMRILGAADRVIGVTEEVKTQKIYFPELSKLPSIGKRTSPDYEAILNLAPAIYMGSDVWPSEVFEKLVELPSIKVLTPRLGHPITFPVAQRVKMLGYVFDKREEAEEYIKWYEDWTNEIKERVEGKVLEDEMPRVFYGRIDKKGGFSVHIISGGAEMVDMLPWKNIGKELPKPWTGGHPEFDIEWLVEHNPDIIIIGRARYRTVNCGYGVDDLSDMAAVREDIMNRPELAETNAVKKGRVYVICEKNLAYKPTIVGTAYMAKIIYPDLFKDFDPRVIHQEYLDFQSIDFSVKEHGVFVYPPLE